MIHFYVYFLYICLIWYDHFNLYFIFYLFSIAKNVLEKLSDFKKNTF